MRFAVLIPLVAVLAIAAFGGLEGSYVLPLDHPAIQYESRPIDDEVTRLSQRLKRGEAKLEYDPQTGYLPSLLKLLKIPVSSQVLVFSKTSFQAPKIAPRTPRALYYNDQSAVGFVKSGDVLEILSVDPLAGVVFYTLDTQKVERPSIVRRTQDCLQCHASGGTLGVPGMMVRSVFPAPSGMPIFQAGSFVTDHRSPFEQRWGGWYVTGNSGSQRHMGNMVVEDADHPDSMVGKDNNLTDLQWRFDRGAYLSPHSDIVSLMVLEHQTRMTNLITRVAYETRMALFDQAAMNKALGEPSDQISDSTKHRIRNAAEELAANMLFSDETPIRDGITGTSGFTSEFPARGPRDRQGRSLRDFDLKHRIFRYPCSYMIYSAAFDGLPEIARQYVYTRLIETLNTKPDPVKQATLEILRETKPGFPRS